jgi:type I restriction enzyme R subunit
LTGKEVFQNPHDPLQFLIVCDMLLTGFDAPIVQAMYLDQRMKEHTLLQAVARTNRPFPRKNFGLVVDYVGVGRELAQALAIFDKEDLEGIFTVDDIKREIIALAEAHKKTMTFFKAVKRNLPPEELIQKCLQILAPEDVRVEFETVFREFAKSMDILMPDPCVNPFISDFKFLGMIREGAKNLYRDESLALENCSKKVEALIHAHIVDIGVAEILAPIHITAPDFKEKLQVKGSAKAKASHVEYAIREVINTKVAEDPHYYGSLKEQLETVIETDRKRRKDEADLLKDLVSIKEREERRDLVAKEKNLTPDEFAFYGLLADYEQGLTGHTDEKRIALAKKLIEIIKNKRVIDWTEKEDVQKEMRREIKNILREIKFPEDKREFFTREVLELARVRLVY